MTQRSRSGLAKPLSGHSVGTYPETSSHARKLSGNIRPQSSQLAVPLWTDPGLKSWIRVCELISTSKKKGGGSGGRAGMNGRTVSQNPRKRGKSHHHYKERKKTKEISLRRVPVSWTGARHGNNMNSEQRPRQIVRSTVTDTPDYVPRSCQWPLSSLLHSRLAHKSYPLRWRFPACFYRRRNESRFDGRAGFD